ncbi:diguanylate cyclase (GGDEF)-like protein [Geothermobacter ehrlichii]|uniref:Diguanylate cyclase (GGDEF)-like protein n=1 Tax=Geothermobacter ehrlichii TaxID=213224 RepID=A0A5D3WN77_9BACT|nr:GGDEF and EAL domain-containing protein [Geothermobacter ehrlichii]TYO99050.1 diguanylate cyclase (GGDEF)-like protein [Geothermobacter ehrlichii]
MSQPATETTFDWLPLPALLLDVRGRPVAGNRRFGECFPDACRDDGLAGLPSWLEKLPEELAARVALPGQPVSLQLPVADPVLACRLPDEAGGGWLLLLPDENVRFTPASDADITTLLEGLPDPVCVIEAKTLRIVHANQVFREAFAEKGDPIGCTCHEITHDSVFPCADARGHCAVRRAIGTGQRARAEHVHPDDVCGERFFEAIAQPLAGSGGRVDKVLYCLRDVTEARRSREEIRQLSNYDPLTGLPNRVLFVKRLGTVLERASLERSRVAVMFLDLDRFKSINDTLGHNIGDMLLLGMSGRLGECLRRVDVVARVGGDEFVVILPDLKAEGEAEAVAERCLARLAEAFDIEGQEVFSTVSIGLAYFPDDGQDEESLLKNAEFAMYQAKEKGRNTWQRFSLETNAGAVERLVLETGLRHALERQEIFLHFQPQVRTVDGVWVGAEALCRWRHPYLGQVPPVKFIPVAEECGLITEIGAWVLAEACRQGVAWQRQGLPALHIGINLSARQFATPGLVESVESILRQTGIDPRLVELELTESMLMDDAAGAAELLHRLRRLGVRLAIDDFGTGYSSLSYLKHFPIDRVKIDRSFIKDLETDPDSAAIAGAIIAMSHSLGLAVVAEGVETEGQLAFLRERGCDEIQGYYFGKPMSAEDFSACLRRQMAAADRI